MTTESLPWYRYFMPWLLVTLLTAAVVGSFVSGYLALHTTDVVLEHADQSE